MKRISKPSLNARRLEAANKRLMLENSILDKKINLIGKTMENSFGGLVSGLMAGAGSGGPQDNLTSFNPSLRANIYAPFTLMWQDLLYSYKTHGLLQTAIDAPVLDALRDGLDITSDQLSQDEIGQILDFIEENGVLDRIIDTFIWARLFGGAALIINSDDSDSSEPLGELGPDINLEFIDACRWELTAERRIPQSGKYGFYGRTVDASRVLTVVGKRAPYIVRAQLSDWGMSEMERMIMDWNVYLRGRNVIYDLLEEAKVDVYQLEGFRAQLATPQGTAITQRRVQQMNQLKNFNNALIMDKLDTYDQKHIQFGGLADLMKESRIMIASALRIPMNKLFGLGSTGFASGEDDLENYAMLIKSEVQGPMKPIIRKVLRLVAWKLFGDKDTDIDFKFPALRILNGEQEEAIKSSKTTRYLSLYNAMLMNSKEVGEALQKDGLVPIALEAEQGLLDDHPMPAMGQAGPTGQIGGGDEDGEKKPAAEDKSQKSDGSKAERGEKPETEKPEKASAEKPEKPKAEKAK